MKNQAKLYNPSFIEDIKKTKSGYEVGNTTYQDIDRPPPERVALLKAIQVLKTYDMDWDGNNSLPPHPQALKTADQFACKVAWQRVFPNAIYPGTDQSIVMEWSNINQNGDKLILTIEPYFIGAMQTNIDGTMEDLGDYTLLPEASLPESLQNIIPRT